MSPQRNRSITLALSFVLSLMTFHASSEDIDIFSVDIDNNVNKPNVLIILENSSNWSRAAQQWPGGVDQGQSEVRALQRVLNNLPDNSVNVGLLEHRTGSNDTNNLGGYIRFHMRPMNSENKALIGAELEAIFANINDPIEKRSASNSFGDLFYDAYNYLSGGGVTNMGSGAGIGTPATLADTAAYSTNFTQFRSPLTESDSCNRTIIIFIGNNGQGILATDRSANISALEDLGGNTDEIPFTDYTITEQEVPTELGLTNACYASATACTTGEAATCTEEGFSSCTCDAADYVDCVNTTANYEVVGVTGASTTTTPVSDTTTDTAGTSLGEATECRNNPPNTACTLPGSTTTTLNNTPVAGQTTTRTSSWLAGTCSWVNTAVSCGTGGKTTWDRRATKRVRDVVVQTVVVPGTQTELGESTACYSDLTSCTADAASAFPACGDGTYESCSCREPANPAGCPSTPTGNKRFQVNAVSTQTEAIPQTTTSLAPAGRSADEWSRFLAEVGVPIPGTSVRSQAKTYALDVFNRQQNADYSAYFFNIANVSGGKYYQTKNEDQIEAALEEIFAEVQAVNTAFSSASLPVSATNRAQNENQVFLGLFRPDRTKKPRWFGNLKRYQVIRSGSDVDLGDKDGDPAINSLTGFLGECAASYWTTDSGSYWSNVITDDPAAVGTCPDGGADSDLPDGPFVEKGAAAQVLRHGNNPAADPDGSGNYALNRTVYTRPSSPGDLIAFNATNAPSVDANTMRFIRGEDIFNEDLDLNVTEPRSTIHGDVVHSRPQPVNYGRDADGNDRGIVVYYGSNDGVFRAVRAVDGVELWSFVAPEHFDKLDRVRDNTPTIRYPGDSLGSRKDYFFDGSVGLLQNRDNTKIFIYPSMRRGGRKIYAFDVTTARDPQYMWSKGCDDAGTCDTGFTRIGQTWSQPRPALINGRTDPVVIFGGGYDTCEDTDARNPTCSTPRGAAIYVVDAETGTLLKDDLTTDRSVVADVALVDTNFDGSVDYAYAVDTGGGVYRVKFAADVDDWEITKIAYTDGDSRKFLFAPSLLQTTNTATNETVVYLAVGTGDREHPLRTSYPYVDSIQNRFYVFKDIPAPAVVDEAFEPLDLDSDQMLNQSTPVVDVDECTERQLLPDSTTRGWYVNLEARGEQTVTSAVIAANKVSFSTNAADPPSGDAVCTNSLGDARGYTLNLITGAGALGATGRCGDYGTEYEEFAGGGLPPSPVIATVPVCTSPDNCIIETICIGCGGGDSPLSPAEVPINIPSSRDPIYWYTTGDAE